MLPVVAIVGRPNVGKSTLFNRLTHSSQAIVTADPGTTRDRQFGMVYGLNRKFIIIDTGGLETTQEALQIFVKEQTLAAIQSADKILFVIDGTVGITEPDLLLAKQLRHTQKPILLIVNKTEKLETSLACAEAYALGFAHTLAISAKTGKGIPLMIETLFPDPIVTTDDTTLTAGIKIAIAGKPNVGKSTLINRLLGEQRVIVHDQPGTTRDSIYIPLVRYDQSYTLIDTAGVRRRTKVTELPEKYSVVQTLKAIEASDVVIHMIDAKQGATDQDLKLLDFILSCGKALVIAVNKWDGLSEEEKTIARNTLDRHFEIIAFARIHFISAKYGSGVGNLFDSIDEAYASATKKLPTPLLSKLLQQAVTQHAPPLVKGRRIKLRYAHAGGTAPPIIVIHGSQLQSLPDSYHAFLSHFFIKHLKLRGTPLKIQFKSAPNPYARHR